MSPAALSPTTPHNGASTDGKARRGDEFARENLRRFVNGEALHNVVDKSAGY
ncbi:hypothetical protein [Kribbella turkmenica]|uniref:hypothetical protein n=1 Tax=Kribbella turkmenica TaxID=2530375 RepID=UPI001F3B7713|nr:hypothetical protein [Kribbella turkmenica]